MANVNENVTVKIREDGSRQVARNVRGIGDAADDAHEGLLNLKTVLLGLVSAATVGSVLHLADQFTNLQNRLRLVTTDSANLAKITKELGKIANDTRSDFSATAELYARMAISSKELGLSQQDLLQFTKSLNQAVILSGASAEEAAGGIRQLSQGMASGTLRGDELNSVLENLPAVADIIAKGLGVTRGELRKMGQDGKLTAGQIVEAFKLAKDELEQGFGTTIPTMGQSLTVLKNNFMLFIGEMDRSYGVTAKIAAGIMAVSNNLDTIVPVLAGVAVAIATAFSPLVIMAFAAQIKALWLLMLANPFVALAALIAGVVTSLYLMRDAIKLGIDDTTTLGDLMRAAWESIGPMISAVGETVRTVFGFIRAVITGDAAVWNKTVDNSTKRQESSWLSVVRVVAQVFDMIGATIRGTYRGLIAATSVAIEKMMDGFRSLGTAARALLKGDFEGVADAVKAQMSNVASSGAEMGAAFNDAFQQEVLRQSDSGLEAQLDKWIARAKEIGKARKDAEGADSPFAPGGPPVPPPVPAEDTKKAAKELERLKNALRNVMDAADPVGAAQRQLAEAEGILTEAVKKHLIAESDKIAIYNELAFQMREQLNPLGALNESIDDNIRLLRMGNQEREIEGQMLQLTKQLRRDGKILTDEETAALRAKLTVEQELARISQARDQFHDQSSVGQMKAFTDQLNGLLAEMQGGSFGAGDAFGAVSTLLPWANLEGSQMQMDAFIQMHADMYAQVKALEDKGVLDHRTAEMLKAQADAQFNQLRLKGTMDFFGALSSLSGSSNRKLAAIGKAAAITQATMKGYLAIQEALAAPPGWPYNAGSVIAVTAMQAANVASIASQPAFRTGGEFMVGGSGGVDSQLVSLRATPGEKIRVNTPSQDRALRQGGEGREPQVVRPNLNVVVLQDPALVGQYLQTSEGEDALVVTLDRNGYRKG